MKRRAFKDSTDLDLLQAFNANSLAETQGCGFIHPGDIAHRLFNGNKQFDPSHVLTIWEDAGGVAAWVLAEPTHECFDAQIRPSLKGSEFAAEVLEYAEERTLELVRQHGSQAKKVWADAFRCDRRTVKLLERLGWTQDQSSTWTENRLRLVGLSAPLLPAGYSIRTARGIEEAEALAAVHRGAFPRAKWTAELYRKVMESPGYAPEREYVVEAPDGSFAAFGVTWHDLVNRTGLFEPVGTHSDHRRKGLARALLQYVMQQMAAAGLEQAVVVNDVSNVASRSLYRACGFLPWQQIDDYYKELPS